VGLCGLDDHVVGTYNGAALTIYLDGVLRFTYPDLNVLPALTGPLYIGTRNTRGVGFSGGMDEVAVYSHALPLERVKAHWQMGSAKP
jgi:hypothetical protein